MESGEPVDESRYVGIVVLVAFRLIPQGMGGHFPDTLQEGDTVAKLDILSPEFSSAAETAWDRAREEALARDIPVFYRDDQTAIEIMEQPDGRRFEIRFIPGAPRQRNFEIIRELARNAA